MKEEVEIVEQLEAEETSTTEEFKTTDSLEENDELQESNIKESENTSDVETLTEDNLNSEYQEKKQGKTAIKNSEAAVMISKAKEIAQDAENQLDECSLLLASDLKDYDEAKNSLKENAINNSKELLNSLGYEKEEELVDTGIVYEAKEQPKSIIINDISTGGFVNSIFALFAGIFTLIGLVYVASTKVNFTPDFSKVPTLETFNSIFNWYSALLGMKSNPLVGLATIVLVSLIVMVVIYKLCASRKANKNLLKAETLLNDAQEYSENKSICKAKMEIVDKHIKDSILNLNTYEVILKEQKAKLERILFIESDKVESLEFHAKSVTEIHDTQSLIGSVEEFMAEPMSSEGELSTRSITLLKRSQDQIQQVLNRLY